MAKRNRIPIANLSADAIMSTPVDYTWPSGQFDYDGDGDGKWRARGAEKCEECGALIVLDVGQGGEKHSDLDPESTCNGYVGTFEGPMMSYYYPIDQLDLDTAARAVADLPLCAVDVDGQTGLALTGGGMDLSWEICRAFIACGYLPPLHFIGRLPRMAGMTMNAATREVLAAADATIAVEERRLARDREDLARLAREIRRAARQRRKDK